jgi:PAS domain S-box-containing protein
MSAPGRFLWRVDEVPVGAPPSTAQELELLHRAVGALQENVYLLDREIRYVYVNPFGASAMGRSPAEMIGRTIDEVFGPAAFPELQVELRAVFATGAPARSEIGVLDGEQTRWFEYTLSPVSGLDGQVVHVICVGRDVTTRRRLEREATLARAAVEDERRKLEAAAEFEQKLLGIVSHDLRNPLASVRLGLETMRRRGLPPEHLRALERMERSTERMQAIIGGLLDLTRIRQGQGLPLAPERVTLEAAVSRAMDGMPEDQVRRVLRVSAAQPTGMWDPERLAQAVGNLVGNALQHGEPGRPVTVRIAEEEGRAALSVHNHGPPIPPEVLASIFEPFQRGLNPGALDGSIGLGLYIVRQVARAHGGEVRVRSVEGEGTTFTIELPLETVPPTAAR